MLSEAKPLQWRRDVTTHEFMVLRIAAAP